MEVSFKAAVANDNLDNVDIILSRLRDLPEFGMIDKVRDFRTKLDAVHDLEHKLRLAKERARDAANAIAGAVCNHWSDAQISEATGYASFAR